MKIYEKKSFRALSNHLFFKGYAFLYEYIRYRKFEIRQDFSSPRSRFLLKDNNLLNIRNPV